MAASDFFKFLGKMLNINNKKHQKKNVKKAHECKFRRVTRRGEGRKVSPAIFQNLKKSALILGKNALTRFVYGFNFSFKMRI